MRQRFTGAEPVAIGELGESLCGLRLSEASAQREMEGSLRREGQVTPLVCYRGAEGLEVIDGFKRLRAARRLLWPELWAETVDVDETEAKLLILEANTGAVVTDLEQAWVVRALYRQDRLTQGQIGHLLGRDKSWVSRRLLLAEGLSSAVEADVRLGLITASAAREIGRLPRGNQDEVAGIVCSRGLTSRQVWRLVDELLDAGEDDESRRRILRKAAGKGRAADDVGGSRKPTVAESLLNEASGIGRLCVRLSARLLDGALCGLDEGSAGVVRRELVELRAVLMASSGTIERVITAGGNHDERS